MPEIFTNENWVECTNCKEWCHSDSCVKVPVGAFCKSSVWHYVLCVINSPLVNGTILLSFLARIPYILIMHFYTQIYIIISGTYTLYTYLSFLHTDLSIMTIFLHLISPRQCWMSRIVYSILIYRGDSLYTVH